MSFATSTAERDALVLDWERKAQVAKAAAAAELEARNKLVAFFYENITDKAGTENVELHNGYKLKMEFRQNFSVPSAKNGEACKAVIAKLTALGPEGAAVAARIFRWKPELSKTEYDLLSPQAKRIVDKVVTQKAGQPSVEIVAPKV